MAFRITFDVLGEVVLDRTIDRAADHVEDFRPVWEVYRGRFLEAERRQFASEGAYGSGGWAPLSPRYAAWKARHFPGQPIMRRTDDLFHSLTDADGPAIAIMEPSYAIFGSDVLYGVHHQRGDPPVPRRRVLELPESERRAWVKIAQRYIVTGDASL